MSYHLKTMLFTCFKSYFLWQWPWPWMCWIQPQSITTRPTYHRIQDVCNIHFYLKSHFQDNRNLHSSNLIHIHIYTLNTLLTFVLYFPSGRLIATKHETKDSDKCENVHSSKRVLLALPHPETGSSSSLPQWKRNSAPISWLSAACWKRIFARHHIKTVS